MHTLIKWPGGKAKEFNYIKELVPPFERYVEPFFGVGAVFFQLRPEKSIINDIRDEKKLLIKLIKRDWRRVYIKQKQSLS